MPAVGDAARDGRRPMARMTSKKAIAVVVAAVVIAVALIAFRYGEPLFSEGEFLSMKGFEQYPLPLRETFRLFDIGVVDANGDGRLDVYTSNHHFRQALLIADGKGGYRDVLTEWGLEQSVFPLAELSFVAPTPEKPGVYVYWLGTNFVIRTHRIAEIGEWHGSMRVFDPVEVLGDKGFRVDKREAKVGEVTETTIGFSAAEDGTLVLRPGGQGLPLEFAFGGAIQPTSVFVGLGKASPKAASFSLAMQDRHAHAWADFNADGVMDLFVNRGALAGTLRAFPPQIARAIRDELFLSRSPGRFEERGAQAGLEKNGCSGRHAQWVDFDGDGLLDLFVNCYDRENFAGDYPKQLYRQGPEGVLRNVAEDVGLGLPDQQMANLVWFDADGDDDADLLAFQDDGLFLYRNERGSFIQEAVVRRTSQEARKIGQTRGNYWFYDGKFAVADDDGDGDLDVFSSSKRGNVLLRNQRGKLEVADLAALGLPPESTTAIWVDYDNDGLPDLHLIPQGLYRQRPGGTFERTGILATHPDRYQAAIVNWADLDNDGRLDVLIALDENPDFRHWWEFRKQPKQRGRWQIVTLRNTAAAGHWLQVELSGQDGNRQGIGATVAVKVGESTRLQSVGAHDGSFFSQGHYRTYFGLGERNGVDAIVIRWPDGVEQQLGGASASRRIRIDRRNEK
jgi:hypothetical protein